MADNRGFIYEEKINRLLKKYGLEKSSFRPAGSDPNAPDALITKQSVDYKTEVKLDLKVDFGQGALDYDMVRKEWRLGETTKTPAADAMRGLLNAANTFDLVNRAWKSKGAPRKFTVPLDRFKKADSDYDQRMFPDAMVNVSGDAISHYYMAKHTYYIQIGGGYGLYYMGEDVAGFGVSEFKPQIRLRIRRKRGGSMPLYNYRFSTALQVVSLPRSNTDLEKKDDIERLAELAGIYKNKR
jgi:hypothetical protein